MSKLAASVILALLLASCSAPSEFIEDEPAEDVEDGDGEGGTDTPGAGGSDNPGSGDPQSLRAFYGGEVNSIEYDPGSGELVINNLPFDGQSYHEIERDLGIDGFQTFANSEDALRRYFAVRRETDSVEVAAVGTGDYAGTGYGGYLVRRESDTVDLPATGEAIYRGPYAGIRVQPGDQQDDKNIAFSQGDATLEVDFGDFDVVGAVEGRIENRRAVGTDGEDLGELSAIELSTGEIEGSGRFSGTASGGSYVGLFSGPNGEEAGGVILVDTEGALERGVFTVEN